MEAKVTLGRVWGIPIGLHGSWFLIFILVTWSLAAAYFPSEYPQLSTAAYWVLGGLTSILFFSSVLLHELGHAFVALRNSVPVRRITLFIFGGVAQMAREPLTPGGEFRIAIAGPIVSLALAGLFGGLFLLDRGSPLLAAPSIYLARINLILAVFNMIPGFPLDGGRVFRSIVWKLTNSYRRATEIAAMVGQWIAFGFIGFGVLTILRGNFMNGLWLVLIGWFLQNAASSSYAQMTMRELLRGVTVSQVMVTRCQQVAPTLTLGNLVKDEVLAEGQSCFFISDQDRVDGLLTLRDITAVPREQWDTVTVNRAMIPREKLVSVGPQTELLDALTLMDDADVAQVPVIENGSLMGMLSREQILHTLRTRSEFSV